jgi:Cu/Ag efflux pump CusA
MQHCAAPAVVTGVGFIALAGAAAEFGVVLLQDSEGFRQRLERFAADRSGAPDPAAAVVV